jgi:formylglycine-generating enzyme required for sulfatase activity
VHPGSRSTGAAPSARTRCPRCGAAIAGEPKFCSNCAFRLRPDLLEPHALPVRAGTVGPRLVALGGYLAFASLLLALALVGIRLFVEVPADAPPAASERVVLNPRDLDAIPLSRESFVDVEAGRFLWGPDSPGNLETMREYAVDDPFAILAHEVTNDQYYLFLLETAREEGRQVDAQRIPPGWDRPDGSPYLRRIYPRRHGNRPVTGVRFGHALEFCQWVWRTRFRADRNLVVDLPTCYEFVRAGRGDSSRMAPGDGEANYSGALADAKSPAAGVIGGIFGLLGNAAEWVHGPDEEGTAAGGSYEDVGRFAEPGKTPFGRLGFESQPLFPQGNARVGFRVVVRRAPALPAFVPVEAGPVRYGPAPDDPEWRERVVVRLVARGFEPGELDVFHLRPSGEGAVVPAPFEIARTEITNRQYLIFLVETAEERRARIDELLPGSFDRVNPATYVRVRETFGPADRVTHVYRGGQENLPVQGVRPEQARAYAEWLTRHLKNPRSACALPTVAQFVRAGRGDRLDPYPWGDDRSQRGLVARWNAIEPRPFSLLGWLGRDAPPLVGLCGNVLEYVIDEATGRELLAGGCFDLPARYCTLDSFLAPGQRVLLDVGENEGAEEAEGEWWQPTLLHCGFRVVRVSK